MSADVVEAAEVDAVAAPPSRVVLALALAGPVGIAAAAYGFGGVGGWQPWSLGSWAFWLVLGTGAVWTALGIRVLPAVLDRRVVLLVIAAALLARALLLPLPFLTSTDAYRFLWDGRVQAEGVNPYRHPPRAAELNDLRDEVVFPALNRKAVVTVYPPVAQMTFLAANRAGVTQPWGWKAVLLVVEGASLALLARLATRRRSLVLYAWNPVPIIAFGLAGHLDAFVVLGVLAAVAAWRSGHRPMVRAGLVGLGLGLAAGFKLWPLLLLPAFARQRDGRLRLGQVFVGTGVAVGVLALSYVPYVRGAGHGVLGFLAAGFLQEEGYTSGQRFQLLRLAGVTDPVWALGITAVVAAAVALVVLASRADAAARAAWLFGAAALLTTPYGWYVTPLIALAVAGSAGAAWAWFPLTLEAAYLTFFHNVWEPWLGDDGLAYPVRRAGAATVVALLVAAITWPWARRMVAGRWTGSPAGARPGDAAGVGSVGARGD